MFQEIDLVALDESVAQQTKTIAKNVRYLRKSSRIKIKDFADLSGLSDSKVSDIENGRASNMELRTLTRLAMALNINVGDLVRDWGN